MADLISILKRYSPHASNYKARRSYNCQFEVHVKPPIHGISGFCSEKKPEVKRLETSKQYTTSHFASCLLSSVLTSATELMQI